MANITFSEASGLNNSIYGKSQAPLRLLIESKAESFEERSILNEVFMMDESKNWAEKYSTLTAMDGFDPVGENGAYPLDGTEEGFSKTLEHLTWKNSFAISREIMEDGKLLDLKKKPVGFVKSYYRTRENLGAALFGAAIQGKAKADFRGRSFDVTTADGQNLFSKTHKAKCRNGNQCNFFSDAFSSDALAYAETAMQNFKGDNGELVNVAPNTILIPNDAALKKEVFAVLGAEHDPETANNGYNYQFGRWNVLVWNYLNPFLAADAKPWILCDLDYNKEVGGAIFTDRTPLDVRSTIDENTDANVWRGYARFTAGFNDWRAFCLGGVSGGTSLLG
ncbi:MAG: Mu-like prophage major head subunit gpT family protein [Firmicutes bacterium]|nr:Mu-like prophage major head subunit gpT family protein [Bacillota bacterium]